MKARVAYTVDVDDDFRRAVNDHYGRPGLATRDEIRSWYEHFGHSMDLEMAQDLEQWNRDWGSVRTSS